MSQTLSLESSREDISKFRSWGRGGKSARNRNNVVGGVGIGSRGGVFVLGEEGKVRKSSEGVGKGGVVFEVVEGDGEDEGFMVLYCEDDDDGGAGLLRVIELNDFSIIDEYECDVAFSCMSMIGM